jgi:hypothetical protein
MDDFDISEECGFEVFFQIASDKQMSQNHVRSGSFRGRHRLAE